MTKYEIFIGGYGGEVMWNSLTEEQYEYWSSQDKEYLEKHVLGFEHDDFDENNLPEFANLTNHGELEWNDLNDIDNEYYCSANSAWLNVQKITNVNNSIQSVEVFNLRNIMNDDSFNLIVDDDSSNRQITEPYVLQIYSSEKGTFFRGTIEIDDNNLINCDSNNSSTEELFDINKLKITVSSALNGIETKIDSVYYDGIEIENEGSETNCKGIEVFLVEF